MEFEFLDPTPYSLIGTDAHVGFVLPSGLVQVPVGLQSTDAMIEITSVSTSPTGDRPLVRRQEESFFFQAPSDQYPKLTSMEPPLLQRGERSVVRGSNLGDAPRLYNQDTRWGS